MKSHICLISFDTQGNGLCYNFKMMIQDKLWGSIFWFKYLGKGLAY